MASTEQLNALMAETGAVLELAQVLGFDEGGWALGVDEDTTLFVDHEVDQHRIVLTGEVAAVRPAAKAAVHELLLQYNNQWRSTGGVRLALDGPDGSVIQICDLSTAQLDAQAFAGAVQVFIDILRGWRDILSRDPANGGTAPDSLEMQSLGFIRG
ncbi:MAG: hypothetical protein V7608_5220 [Hyphomicrobiales bacterium]|jgi:hypothetical protein